jgi:hypothetical protein
MQKADSGNKDRRQKNFGIRIADLKTVKIEMRSGLQIS